MRAAWANAASVFPFGIGPLSAKLFVVVRYASTASRVAGSGAGVDHVTFRFFAAWIAAHSVCATTPTKVPSCTTLTIPLMPAIELSSTRSGFEIVVAGLITRPCSMPGSFTSVMYVKVAASFAGSSTRFTEVPTTLYSVYFFGVIAGATCRPPCCPVTGIVMLNLRPPINAPYDTLFDRFAVSLTTPSVTDNRSTGTSRRVDAIFSSSTRAAAVACRRCGPAAWRVLLPAVRPWSTVFAVSPICMCTRANGTSSSSAAICASAVSMPVPRSTLPVETITVPSSRTATHESS